MMANIGDEKDIVIIGSPPLLILYSTIYDHLAAT